ncbi:MAG: hypothetical protein COA99_10750 [Moraxellaceae bacterium]|nr:MAG: hypothetical protein COA99_10750 [Moraxellaceae bacterium]
MNENPVQHALTASTFFGLRVFTRTSDMLSLPVVSTGRSFSYYRKIFFGNRSESQVLENFKGKIIADIGCGLTPYISDSMFQACRREGVDFYGIDPKLAKGFKLGSFDKMKARLFGGAGTIDANAPGLEKGFGTLADDLPFEDSSVDLILSNYVIYAWIEDEVVLESIFREFLRVLKPGGQVKIFPTRHIDTQRPGSSSYADVMSGFDIKQRFVGDVKRFMTYPPAYVTTYTKR